MYASFNIFPAVWQSLVNFYLLPLSFFYSCTLITGPPLIPVLITQDVKIILFKYDDDYDDDADDDDDGDDDDDVDDDDDDDDYYYIITKYLMFKQIYSDQWHNL